MTSWHSISTQFSRLVLKFKRNRSYSHFQMIMITAAINVCKRFMQNNKTMIATNKLEKSVYCFRSVPRWNEHLFLAYTVCTFIWMFNVHSINAMEFMWYFNTCYSWLLPERAILIFLICMNTCFFLHLEYFVLSPFFTRNVALFLLGENDVISHTWHGNNSKRLFHCKLKDTRKRRWHIHRAKRERQRQSVNEQK